MRIVESDQFLDMPATAQNLYWHLGMYADDDGFVSPNKVVRMVGANADDLKVLLAKSFAIPFDSGVIVITNWKENNYIQTDRYTPTIYTYEKQQLSCIQNVYKLDTQVRVEVSKVRLGKVRIGKVTTDTTAVVSAKPDQRNLEVQEIIESLTTSLSGILMDGTQKENRRYAFLMLNKVKKLCREQKQDEINSMKIIKAIILASQQGWHQKNATSIQYIYRNMAKIIQETKVKKLTPIEF